MNVIQKRLSVLVYVSIVGLLLTGVLLARRTPAFEGCSASATPILSSWTSFPI